MSSTSEVASKLMDTGTSNSLLSELNSKDGNSFLFLFEPTTRVFLQHSFFAGQQDNKDIMSKGRKIQMPHVDLKGLTRKERVYNETTCNEPLHVESERNMNFILTFSHNLHPLREEHKEKRRSRIQDYHIRNLNTYTKPFEDVSSTIKRTTRLIVAVVEETVFFYSMAILIKVAMASIGTRIAAINDQSTSMAKAKARARHNPIRSTAVRVKLLLCLAV